MCGHFAFLCVHKVCLSFCASDIKLCMPGCPSVLVWLRFKYATNAHRSTSHHFFTRKKQPCTFPMICSDPCTTATSKARNQQLLAITGTSTVDGDMKQLFWASRSCIMHYMCSHICANWKVFNFELVKVVLRQKFNLFSMWKKRSWEIHWKLGMALWMNLMWVSESFVDIGND